jgi:hypothetical protein
MSRKAIGKAQYFTAVLRWKNANTFALYLLPSWLRISIALKIPGSRRSIDASFHLAVVTSTAKADSVSTLIGAEALRHPKAKSFMGIERSNLFSE